MRLGFKPELLAPTTVLHGQAPVGALWIPRLGSFQSMPRRAVRNTLKLGISLRPKSCLPPPRCPSAGSRGCSRQHPNCETQPTRASHAGPHTAVPSARLLETGLLSAPPSRPGPRTCRLCCLGSAPSPPLRHRQTVLLGTSTHPASLGVNILHPSRVLADLSVLCRPAGTPRPGLHRAFI